MTTQKGISRTTQAKIAEAVARNRTAVVEACKTQLAIDFDTPARDILSFHGSKLGMTGVQMEKLLRSLIAD